MRLDPGDFDVIRSLGQALEQTGQSVAANRLYRKYLEGFPGCAAAKRLLVLNNSLWPAASGAESGDHGGTPKVDADLPIWNTLPSVAWRGYEFSRTKHFSELEMPAFHLGQRMQSCDLKVYQDMLTFNFLLSNLPRGSRILEVGGGDSRIIRALSGYYECWNLDKFEGSGNGPIAAQNVTKARVVMDYIGNYSKELPDEYFDCVYSISTLEHVPEEPEVFENIAADMRRILRPGGCSLHCFDIVITGGDVWTNGLLDYLHAHEPVTIPKADFSSIDADSDVFVMSEAAYNASWKQCTGTSYKEFGRPLSYNVFWRKPGNP
jgi:SAM-dependent methyltransferase